MNIIFYEKNLQMELFIDFNLIKIYETVFKEYKTKK